MDAAIANKIESILRQAQESTSKREPILKYDYACVADNIFLHYCRRVLATAPEVKDEAKAYRIIEAVAKWLTDAGVNKNLNISGSVGLGKSTILAALMDFLNRSEVRYSKTFVTANNMAKIALESEPSWERITTVPILLLDDVGTEPYEVKEYGNVYLPFTELIEQRYNRRLTTIITTNLSIEDINNRYGARIADRINEWHSIRWSGNSYRNG